MARDFILFITDDLRPYLGVLERGLESLERHVETPFFQFPATRLSSKPQFARVTLSPRAEALLYKLKKPNQNEQEVLHAALMAVKKEREQVKRYYRPF
jgi:hypothetical protein